MNDVDNKQHKRVTLGISLALISSLIFAFVPNFAKIALDSGVSLFFLVISRYAIGALVLVFVMQLTRKKLRGLSSEQIFPIVISGFSACAVISLTYHAVEYLDVGVVMIVLYCFPIGVAVVLQIQEKQQLLKKQWFFMALAVLGLSVMLADKNFDLNIYGLAISFLGLIFFICTGLYAFFTIQERLNKLETADTLFQADLLKKAEQEPKNLEMYMLIEHLAGQIESIEKEIEASRYNKVNIDHLKEQVDMLQKKINGTN